TFETLEEYFTLIGVDYARVFQSIDSLIVKTMISVHGANASGVRLYVPNRTTCYELFGFDVLLDDTLKPWLMEVNISPSLKATCDFDYRLKSALVADLLNLVGIRVGDVELCRVAQSRKRSSKWRKTLLTATERTKQKRTRSDGSVDFLAHLTDDDMRMLKETEDEHHRRGNFARLLPGPLGSTHLPLFTSMTYYDQLLYHWTRRESNAAERVQRLRDGGAGAALPPLRTAPAPSTPNPVAKSPIATSRDRPPLRPQEAADARRMIATSVRRAAAAAVVRVSPGISLAGSRTALGSSSSASLGSSTTSLSSSSSSSTASSAFSLSSDSTAMSSSSSSSSSGRSLSESLRTIPSPIFRAVHGKMHREINIMCRSASATGSPQVEKSLRTSVGDRPREPDEQRHTAIMRRRKSATSEK
ncbi:tubulin-tyrosine ligase family-domain-containing protein, partial [Blyttiomyces helicus]